MPDENEYESLLDRALEAMPKDEIKDDQRWSLPPPDLMYEGRNTVVKNFQDIVDSIRREPEHILGQVLRELGSAGSRDGRRLILKSQVSREKLDEKLEEYVNRYVICGECGKPDTHLIKEGRTQVVECMACGAKRHVKVKKGLKAQDKKGVVIIGDELEVMIQDVGKQGDGLAKRGKFVIYVPGVAKGQKCKITVEKVSGNIVIGKVVPA